MTNHMIIGLGGTGGKIIRALRRSIFQEHGSNTPPGINMEYLYVDSTDAMMHLEDPTWKVLGKSTQLDSNQQLLIRGGADLRSVLENINRYPNIMPWIGGQEQWRSILNSIKEAEVQGGQKRRLGRFLFACKVREFDDRVTKLYNLLKNKGKADITFHVCCGLAGGTGSGTVVDVVSQLRSKFRYESDSIQYRIVVYVLLPERNPKPGWDKGSYHANGYAALMELNAVSVGAWKPYDILEGRGRLDIKDPFHGCYLFYNQNENGLSMDVEESVPALVADFLYHKLVVVPQTGWDGLTRMENAENGDSSAESVPGSSEPQRGKKFLAFGIKRLSVPNEEIKEFMTYHFARQATSQMLFGNWVEGTGYKDEPKNLSFSEEARKKETLERWKLSKEHICLSQGITSDEVSNKKWKTIRQEWMDSIVFFKGVTREQDKNVWLDKISDLCINKFDNSFREHGVKKFYEHKESSVKDYTKEIYRIVSSELFQDWSNGTRSIFDISRLVDALLDIVEEKHREVEGEIVRCKQVIERQNQTINANKREWTKIGPIDLFGKRDKLLDAQALCLQEKYIEQTYQRAWGFAKLLLEILKPTLQVLRTEIVSVMGLFSEGIKDFYDCIKGRCNDSDLDDFTKPVMRFYKPDEVREFTESLIRDRTLQEGQSARVRSALIKFLGESPSFGTFGERVLKQSFRDQVEFTCQDEAIRAHNDFITKNKKARQVDVSIVEKLDREYSGKKDALRGYINRISAQAGNYLLFDPMEESKEGPGISRQKRESLFAAIMPKAPETKDFSDHLKQTIERSRNSGVNCFELDGRKHEIVFISITNMFPLRYVQQVKFLKEKYDQCISKSDNPERIRLELHCETEGGGVQYPKLFIPSDSELKNDGTPYVLLATAMEIFSRYKSPSTGIEEYALILKDEDDIPMDPIRLGRTLTQIPDKLDMMTSETVRVEIMKKLSSDYRHIDKQEELKKGVVKLVEEIKAEQGGDLDAPIYKQFRDAARKAIELIKSRG